MDKVHIIIRDVDDEDVDTVMDVVSEQFGYLADIVEEGEIV